MAHNLTAARPYAKALFALGHTQQWSLALAALSTIVKDAALNVVINDPHVSDTVWLEFFTSVVDKLLPKELAAIQAEIKNFLALLLENKRLEILPDIEIIYQQLLAENSGIEKIEAISAFPLDEAQLEKLRISLEKRLDSKVELTTKTDADLIGGVILRSRKWVLDYSLKDQLMRMRQTLLGGQ